MSTELKRAIEKVAKLRRLAAEGSGATEHEAQLAADMAAEISMEYGITTAMLEMSGGQGEAREKTTLQGSAGEWWQPPLMAALCETCFVWHERQLKQDKADRFLGTGYRLIGRESAVATVRVTYEYLCATIRRAAVEAKPSVPKHFRRGMSERLTERINRRHRDDMRRQREDAERQKSSAPSSSNALVVVMEDYAAKERDLNEDMRRGVAPGTTAREREDSERAFSDRMAKRRVEKARLIAEGVPENVAEYMSYGYSREEAEERCRPKTQPALSDEEQEREAQRSRRRDQRWREGQERQKAKENAKRDSPSWQAGRRRGDEVSLNRQVDGGQQRKLT